MITPIESDAQSVQAPAPPPLAEPDDHATIDRRELARVAFVALAAVAVWFRLWEPFPQYSIIGIVATLIGGYPIFKEALENVLERRMTMELSMTIALVAALSIGQAFTALVITAFVLAAEILEHLTVSRGRAAIGDLLRYLPQSALVRRDGEIRECAAAQLAVGDAVLVNPGAIIPVDGTVIDGHSFVDEARITGESKAAEKSAGSAAYAGTLNGSGALEIRAERLGRDTSFGRIIDAVENAERSRAPIERLADRLAGYLVYFALGAAIVTYALTGNIVATISVIIVAGACGIAAGTPLAVLGAIGRAARAGAIVKGGRYLEALAAVDVVVFDKTGTVTQGRPAVAAIVPAPGVTTELLLGAAAIAECRSEHPLGAAIVNAARSRGIAIAEPESFVALPGRGIRARFTDEEILVGTTSLLHDAGLDVANVLNDTGLDVASTPHDTGLDVESAPHDTGLDVATALHDSDTTDVHVAYAGRYLGRIAIADALRPEARAAVAALAALSIRTVLLTGDNERVARAVGNALGIDEVVAEALPERKHAYIGALVDAGKIVVMVGDGVNDAPALIRATVGVAMGSGTDVARESADVVLLGNDLSVFIETVRIARRTRNIVMQNFAGTIAVDAVGILLAALGLLAPLSAAFIHVASELAFILNATRMLVPRDPRSGAAP